MKSLVLIAILAVVTVTIILPTSANAAYVTPRIGGDQRMHAVAPMIMPEITIVGTNVVVNDMMDMPWVTLTGTARPVMWPLLGTDAFDPAAIWYSALNGKAYNWQYGWNSAGFNPALLPAGGKIWLEVLSQSEGLKTYDRNNSYAPIFGTNGSSTRWMWPQMMAHNAYTVEPGIGEWYATYNVYIGDATTGAAMAGYGSQEVTFTWTSVPEPATLALLGTGLILLRRKKAKA